MLSFLDKIPFGTPRIRRVAFWLLSTFVAYTLIGFLLLPVIVQAVTESKLGEALNRETTIEDVSFNPLTLRLRVLGMDVGKREGDGSFVSVGELDVSPSLSSIYKFAPVISHLRIRNFALDMTFFGDGKYSFSDLMGASQDHKSEETGEEEPAEPIFPFALYGFEMTNATIVFDDRPRGKKHTIEKLDLIVPFTSSFMDLRKEFTKPELSAVVNGDPIHLDGRTLPFDDSLRTEFELGAVDIDLNRYWSYVPLDTPLKLVKGHFTSDISLIFERPGSRSLDLFLAGGGRINNFSMASPDDGEVVSFKQLAFQMEKFSLGDNELNLTEVTLADPYFKIIRSGDGAINWAEYFPSSPSSENEAPQEAEATPPPANPFLLQVQNVAIASGTLDFQDRVVPGGFSKKFEHFTLKASDINSRGDETTSIDCSIGTEETISLAGTATMEPLTADVKISGQSIALPSFRPYLDDALPVHVLGGTSGFHAEVAFSMNGDEPVLTVQNGGLLLQDLAVHKPGKKQPSVGLKRLEVSGTSFDLGAREVIVEQVQATAPMVRLEMNKDGAIDLVNLFAESDDAPQTPDAMPDEEEEEAEETPWTATVKQVKVEEGAASWNDRSLQNPTTLALRGIEAELSDISTAKGATMRYTVSTRWGGGGSLGAGGRLTLDPLKTNGRLWLRKVGLRPFDGHLAEFAELLVADGSTSGDLDYSFAMGNAPVFSVAGNVNVKNMQLKDNWGNGEFAGIDELKLTKFRFANEPYSISTAEIKLDGPRATIRFDKDGRLNVRRAFRIPEPKPASDEEAAKELEDEEKAIEKMAEAGEANVSPETGETPAEEEPFFKSINIGKVSMNNGAMTFTDASVQPEYTADITDMRLSLTDIAQSETARPKVDFSAKIGPTPMSVTGALNPVITPIYSDLVLSVNGMELVPLSPYTIEYLAYPVEKGRLYADVDFKTDNWVLVAENKFFIEQLVLGPKDTRPGAPSVPVKFGLALLQDGNGDMELNLPIRGRLDDPDFHIGGIVFKAIASLFVKALASPFTLIGSIFGSGGEDMDFVLFQPGRHDLDPGGITKLETTIEALTKRKKLSLEVDGVVDPVVDKQGLADVIFDQKVRLQKYEDLPRKERAETSLERVVVGPQEYEEYLFEAYKDAPDEEGVRPTTLFMVDKQPVEVMEKYIRDRIKVTDEDLQELAMQRANAVKQFIIERKPSLADRVFLLDRKNDRQGKTGVPGHRADLGIK